MNATVGVILAAGRGKRMKSDLPKVLHPVGGRAMIEYVIDALKDTGVQRVVVVVGRDSEDIRQLLGDRVEYAVQEDPLGTGDALRRVQGMVPSTNDMVVLYGDTPLLTSATLKGLLRRHKETDAAASVVAVHLEDPTGYGRIIRDPGGRFGRIVEEADAGPAEKAVCEVNTGIYCFRTGEVFRALEEVDPANSQGEYYLVDALPLMAGRRLRVEVVISDEVDALKGVNSRAEMAAAEAALKLRVLRRLWDAGVTVVDPAGVYIDSRVSVGQDTVIYPFTVIEGSTVIGRRCRIGPGAHVIESELADDVRLVHSMVESSRLGLGVSVGPYSHLRAGSVLGRGVRVGNFVEIKNSFVGDHSKVPHHSYLGDAGVGRGVNIGAGVITVNYDGREKHRTEIGDNAFIGCNANLVAPVRVGEGGYVAAGSTINRDVPEGALAIARSRQENKSGWTDLPLQRHQVPGKGQAKSSEGK